MFGKWNTKLYYSNVCRTVVGIQTSRTFGEVCNIGPKVQYRKDFILFLITERKVAMETHLVSNTSYCTP